MNFVLKNEARGFAVMFRKNSTSPLQYLNVHNGTSGFPNRQSRRTSGKLGNMGSKPCQFYSAGIADQLREKSDLVCAAIASI